MIVKLLTSLVSEDTAFNAGETIELPDAAGLRLIEAGLAEPVKKTKGGRTASVAQTDLETTSEPK